jgi:serine/threonine protein kinase
VVHRDIKPENILLVSEADDASLKIVDFGFATEFHMGAKGAELTATCGTPGYVAPEVISGKPYGPEVDMWSLGVVSFVLLCGYPPFMEDSQQALFAKIRKGQFEFDPQFWDVVSESAKDLVSKLLVVDPKARYTPEQVLAHPWIMSSGSARSLLQALKVLRAYQQARRKVKTGMLGVQFIEAARVAAHSTRSLRVKLSPEEASEIIQRNYRKRLACKRVAEMRLAQLDASRGAQSPPAPPQQAPQTSGARASQSRARTSKARTSTPRTKP